MCGVLGAMKRTVDDSLARTGPTTCYIRSHCGGNLRHLRKIRYFQEPIKRVSQSILRSFIFRPNMHLVPRLFFQTVEGRNVNTYCNWVTRKPVPHVFRTYCEILRGAVRFSAQYVAPVPSGIDLSSFTCHCPYHRHLCLIPLSVMRFGQDTENSAYGRYLLVVSLLLDGVTTSAQVPCTQLTKNLLPVYCPTFSPMIFETDGCVFLVLEHATEP